jgi:hypothetical protein
LRSRLSRIAFAVEAHSGVEHVAILLVLLDKEEFVAIFFFTKEEKDEKFPDQNVYFK